MKKITFILLFASFSHAYSQKTQGLALTPPLGWNSWNTFQTNINEQLVKDIADVMVSSGMKDAGYEYLVLDDGWMAMERDKNGNLVADPKKFPHGIKAVADYVHSKGLKFGLYNCAGTKTCAGYPGTRGYEYQDARYYAAHDVDYLKFDWCNTEGINAKEAYTTMSKALATTGRPIVFSMCEWGQNKPWEWAENVGHLWRTTGDISNIFAGTKDMGTWHALGVLKIIDLQKGLRKYAGPGHWNDPDMLEVGNGLTEAENRAHFSMWCMLAAPLIAGNDLRNMSTETKNILINKDAIAVDQDKMGIEGFAYAEKDSVETWLKPLQNGDWAVCFLNRSTHPVSFEMNWKEKPIFDSLSKASLDAEKNSYQIFNIWSKKTEGTTNHTFKATVGAHDVVMLRLKKEN
ncbi:MAG: alpha-galactosidase [Sphingobacteriales bacterium]|uniref:glycoside hydrolase family 27 protein n=1 Tax=Hydrotalea flava TaxID=714549 RepID=UPI0008334614|nr:glycoside hydrolase family 27 protein [Hydrotalea flava]RTL49974.1 MAG: alpha-galactosidase [Sphingobacteriales bacterium]